jgi:hypothetical protein
MAQRLLELVVHDDLVVHGVENFAEEIFSEALSAATGFDRTNPLDQAPNSTAPVIPTDVPLMVLQQESFGLDNEVRLPIVRSLLDGLNTSLTIGVTPLQRDDVVVADTGGGV